jgi:hypothetical protein
MIAVITSQQVATQTGGATGDNGINHLPLPGAQFRQFLDIVSEDISHFHRWPDGTGFLPL